MENKLSSRLKILVVDDEAEARVGFSHALKANGYDVVELASGKQVLATAKEQWPALIILDIVLPDLSGIEVFDQLKADPLTKVIPILLLTAKSDVVKEKLATLPEKSYRYIIKPGRVEDLLKVVREMLMGGKN